MMTKPILEIKHLGKEYKLRGNSEPYKSLRDSLVNSLSNFKRKKNDSFWALKDVNFDIQEGDSIGIIGKNGAGKSTLLKILSKITYPTVGEIIARGRVASLLEVGTGFHPELSGRENVYLNGSILGLTKKEIDRQFDAIVDFSGVERFLDTSLKHYSSGMQLRLAFSVAAHLEPEILVIDEVLAVGDTAFQQKCIKKMTEVSRSGRTIIFVSHNLNAVRSLCERSILLEKGQVKCVSDTNTVIDLYVKSGLDTPQAIELDGITDRSGKGELRFERIRFSRPYFDVNEEIEFDLDLKNQTDSEFQEVDIAVAIMSAEDQTLIHVCNKFIGKEFDHRDQSYRFSIFHSLKPGTYKMVLFFRTGADIQDWVNEGVQFRVERSEQNYKSNSQGILEPKFKVEQINRTSA